MGPVCICHDISDPSRDSGVGVDGDLSEQDVVHRHIKKLQVIIFN